MLNLQEDAAWDFIFTKCPQAMSAAVKASASILEPVYEPINVRADYSVQNGVHTLATADLEPFDYICVTAESKEECIRLIRCAIVRALVTLSASTFKLPPAVFDGLEIRLIQRNCGALP